MRFFIFLIGLLPILASSQGVEANSNAPSLVKTEEWVLVLEDPRPARLQGWARGAYGNTGGDYRGSLELTRFGKKVAAKYDLDLRDQWFIPTLGVYCLVVRFNNNQDETISQLNKDKSVQWLQPSNEFELLSAKSQTHRSDVSDTNKRGTEAQRRTADGSGVAIGIIDSAVDDSHQDLMGVINQAGDYVASAKKTGSGESHGTAIAGVIIGNRDTKLGVAGVAPAATLYAYRGCWEAKETDKTNCNTLSLARALDAVARSKVDILNLSLSGPKDALLDRLLARVIEGGTLVVTAFDPDRQSAQRFPTEREGVIVVRAQGLDEAHTAFFTAPGARVVPVPGNRYDFMRGHSVATAYTTGLLALRKQRLDSSRVSKRDKVDWRNISSSSLARDLMNEVLRES